VELRANNDGSVIARASAVKTEYDFGSSIIHDVPYNRKLAKSFITDLTLLFHNSPLASQRVSIAIPASSMIIATFPVDPHLSDQQRDEQLSWECRTLYGYGSERQIDVQTHLLRSTGDADYFLAAGMPKQTSTFLKSVFSQMALTVSDIDVEHFTVENHIQELIPNPGAHSFAVFGLFETHCAVGVYDRGRYCGFKQASVSAKEGYFAQTLRLLQAILAGEPTVKLEAVFAYGNAAAQPALDALRSILAIPVRRYEPRKATPALDQRTAENLSRCTPHTFDIAASAAILALK